VREAALAPLLTHCLIPPPHYVIPPARDRGIAKFAVAEGDLVSYLNAHRAWAENGRSNKW
jgi:hypothetical protein